MWLEPDGESIFHPDSYSKYQEDLKRAYKKAVKDGRLKWGPFCGLPAYLDEGDPVECETAKHGYKLRKKVESLTPPF